jgi:flagellum-specific peptidoglycan hydrolase FlgJ
VKKYAILLTNANKTILNYLGIKYQETANTIVFEADPQDIHRIANTILTLGYAHDSAYAYKLAASFFLNEVR